jgi:hypothetical protein
MEEIFGSDRAKWPHPATQAAAKIAHMMGVYPPPRADTTGLPRETALDQAKRPCGGLAGLVERLEKGEAMPTDIYALRVIVIYPDGESGIAEDRDCTRYDLQDTDKRNQLAARLASAALDNLKALD